MLFLHETHQVVGARQDEFETAYREGWMPTLAHDDDARLLWYTNHAHGSGASYTVVTITAITDGAAWERLVRRAQQGDLRPWMRELDNLRYDATGKILLPVDWSPLQTVDLAAVPTDGATHPLSLFMEDTGWPYAPLDDCIRSWDEIYYRPLSKAPAGMRILDIQACFQVAHGSHRHREAMLWQKVDDSNNYAVLVQLLTNDAPPEHRGPGSYMYEALKHRDQWQSRLLRTSAWSPLY
ncbi:MAG: hypothetical protein K2X56_17880 [Mycobacterium pseudokansasii]|uniref:hypothetical protein n=1 Tax=Mycobacterium pseudokansasii TaxID=2341080 RepID=UPI0007B50DA4|nr:hypothetical protein [Mycobacterium pseudokansasii]KZS62743.1 hypothetical protein A4G27_00770 [Mycobacterium kansasii]MBY0389909.1 hypothetical protein [Mycobacterium pseudokansasii]VAZ95861.1 hypothetical protein LAUMK35_03131 [Mycobacterium pseudokansasii]VAZ97227.1 hypothetical protein LAUMK21_03132 [Mycobacterium pseudokansasii]